MTGSDEGMTAYGRLRHDLEHGSGSLADPWGLRALLMADHEDALKATVCAWLVGLYGRPFVFHPADGSHSVVVS